MISRNKKRLKNHLKIRTKMSGTAQRPRLSIFKSARNLEVQIVNDTVGKTILSLSTRDKSVDLKYGGNIAAAVELGKLLAPKLKEAKIVEIVFDRSGYIYHGRIKALAETLRQEGVKF